MCCFTSSVNGWGHVGMLSYPNHNFPEQANTNKPNDYIFVCVLLYI